MNGVENITEKILSEARSWADTQIAQSKAQADSLIKEAAEQANAQTRQTVEAAQQKAVSIGERAKSQGDMDRRKHMLATKQQAVGEAFSAALSTLSSLSEEERVLMMVRLAMKHQTGDAQLIFNKADQKTVGPMVVSTLQSLYTREQIRQTFSGSILEQLKKLVLDQPAKYKVELSKTVGSFAGGFILKQGNIESNCTFEVLVNGVRESLEGDVSSILFRQ